MLTPRALRPTRSITMTTLNTITSGSTTTMNMLPSPGLEVERDRLVQPMFKHHPLPSGVRRATRILTLLGCTSLDEPVSCHIRICDLGHSQAPTYTALSYTWGGKDRDTIIYVNGRRFHVTSSLAEALIHLRRLQASNDSIGPHWWIDMICINQDDLAERGAQVSMLREIFETASVVVAWLGPEMNDSARVMQMLGGHEPQSSAQDVRIGHHLQTQRALLTRPFWSRVWIIQELCVARRILVACGNEMIPWHRLRGDLEGSAWQNWGQQGNDRPRFSHYRSLAGGPSVTDFRVLIPYNLIALVDRHQPSHRTLGYLLTSSSQSECTDPRDHIYSLLGLADDASATRLAPDYSLSPCEVFCAAIRAIIHNIYKTRIENKDDIARILARCLHAPLKECNEARQSCEGMTCKAWWCCLDIALLDS